MVGGTVVGVTLLPGKTRLTVQGDGHDRHLECVRIVAGHHGIKPGDGVWWQSRMVMWTPRGNHPGGDGQGKLWDIVLERLS